MEFDAIVIGAGATGVFTALDLAGRGSSVLVLDKGGLARGTSGRYHGVIHSGARYAVTDKSAAIECMEENGVLSRIAPHSILNSGGYYVAVEQDDPRYIDRLTTGLQEIAVPHREVPLDDLKRDEPLLSHSVTYALEVPEKTADPFRLLGGAALLAKNHGARFRLGATVIGLDADTGLVTTSHGEFHAKLIINAAGPWGFKVSAMAGRQAEMVPTVGVMLVYRERLVRHVISRLRMPTEGDLVVPFYDTSILGTTAAIVEDPDSVRIDDVDIHTLVEEGTQMIPTLKQLNYSRIYSSIRPLVQASGAGITTRDFRIVEDRKLVSVEGGKLTTARLMAEKVSDLACNRLGILNPCTTKTTPLPDPVSWCRFEGTIGDEYYAPGFSLANVEKAIQD